MKYTEILNRRLKKAGREYRTGNHSDKKERLWNAIQEIMEEAEGTGSFLPWTEADLHLAAGYLMDLDDTDQRLCKYLLFYSQIIVDLSSFERTEILENINQLNRNVRMGHYFYGPADGKEEEMLQYRVMVSGAEDQPLDEGVVADALLEMGVGYDIALHTFERAAHK